MTHWDDVADGLAQASTGLLKGHAQRGGQPLAPGGPELFDELTQQDLAGLSLSDLLTFVSAHSIDLSHPFAAAHLQPLPLPSAVAGAAVAAALNPSLDSWDQAPIATHIELRVLAELASMIGFDPQQADGVFTSGGTQSNLMGLLLARTHATQDPFAALPAESKNWRILCSEIAHFSVQQAAMVLGLGTESVVSIAVDDQQQMDMMALDETLQSLDGKPIAIVATAGTTDFGSIDPLAEIARRCKKHSIWMHVDAAYGAGLLLSAQHRDLLTGIAEADSVTLDFHKLGWAPASCSVLCVQKAESLQAAQSRAPYLNPDDDEQEGFVNLVAKSLQTTRGFDALKLLSTFVDPGRDVLGTYVDAVIQLATDVARLVERTDELQLAVEPVLSTVVFRYLPTDSADADRCNTELRRLLLRTGQAVIARTEHAGNIWLKLTLLNPNTTLADIEVLLNLIMSNGKAVESAK